MEIDSTCALVAAIDALAHSRRPPDAFYRLLHIAHLIAVGWETNWSI